MKDEIKEINIPENVLAALGDLSNGALNYYKATETVKVRHNTILDYITNLQQKLEYYENIDPDKTIDKFRQNKDNQEFYKNKGIGLNYAECDYVLNKLKELKEGKK